MKTFQPTVTKTNFKYLAITAIIAASASLSACYVVPIDHYQAQQHSVSTPAAPSAVVLVARLYPTNDVAARFGTLNGSVTNLLNGRGEIGVVQGGEVFRGEATRSANDARSGQANAAGNQGGYMSCTYQMNNASQGTGNCRFNNGATYRFHLGQ